MNNNNTIVKSNYFLFKGSIIKNNQKSFHIAIFRSEDNLNQFIEKLPDNFNIIFQEVTIWSKVNYDKNIERLFGKNTDFLINSIKKRRIYSIVFYDTKPNFKFNLAGNYFENSNCSSLLNQKYVYFPPDIDGTLFTLSLLYGLDKTMKLVEGRSETINSNEEVYRDLTGANGWEDFKTLFNFLNYTTNWVILRNEEFLPNNFWGNDKDVDCLCLDLDRFVRLSNAVKRSNGISSYKLKLQNKEVDFDIRFLGDNYYNFFWQKDMLSTLSIINEVVPVLSNQNQFYALIYHGHLHKANKIKDSYINKLNNISQKEFTNLQFNRVKDTDYSLTLLEDFLNKHKYDIPRPLDGIVWLNLNRELIKKIKINRESLPLRTKILLFLIKYKISRIKNIMPNLILNKLKSIKKNNNI